MSRPGLLAGCATFALTLAMGATLLLVLRPDPRWPGLPALTVGVAVAVAALALWWAWDRWRGRR